MFVRIEDGLKRIGPDIERASAGRGGFVETSADRFRNCDGFDEAIHLKGRNSSWQDLAQYLDLWRSVSFVAFLAG
ncbi:hypothetical protein A6A08_22980 [Nocardiopsis sp. TSRI0078]|uniref:hypothetical protein n=1 Tax=unclassified Nocardiopsis TaxID=2649073 RepID=UPI00096289D2|nr:hypothetical protein [Nocardiopsis sp. TSRI0078]OKI20427.1 hypothetical protein A6A08_22980 [Nocardiopsis sp. TSRI0078]